MQNFLKIICQTPLFKDINEEDAEKLLECLKAYYKSFSKNDIVLLVGDEAFQTGIIIEGSVQVVSEDILGNRNILGRIEKGDLFGEAFSLAKAQKLPVSVIALEDSGILFIDSKKILENCGLNCPFHKKLIENTVNILALKNIMLNNKIRYLSMRSTREKLLSYLTDMAAVSESKEFFIPFDRQQLSDFLCVDRSAMSYQLSLLRKEGVLDYRKNRFKFLK